MVPIAMVAVGDGNHHCFAGGPFSIFFQCTLTTATFITY